MNRRKFLATTKSAAVTVPLAKLPAQPSIHSPAAPAPHRRPNVLFIAMDDQNNWLSPLGGHPLAHTPNFERLAARGATFTSAYCQAPLCTPSRTSLMSGLRPTTTGIYGLHPWFRDVPALADHVALPQHFKAHGYTTRCMGKVYHGGPSSPEDRAREFDHWPTPTRQDPRPPQKLVPPTPAGNHRLMDWGVFPHADEDKIDHQVATWAGEQLRELGPSATPWFLACGFAFPHVPCYVNQPWLDLIPDDDRLLPPILADERAHTPRSSWYLHWDLPEPRLAWLEKHHEWRNHVRTYLASMAFMDAQLGRILDALDASGAADNTYIVVWGDHGYHHGEKAITGKNALWRPATNVPLFISGPGLTPGRRISSPAELLDIYPTLVELCGLAPRPDLEGLSLVPQLRDPAAPRARPAITTCNPGNHAVRSERWSYLRYADGSEELYDRAADPREWQNLATAPTHREIIAAHRAWLPANEAKHVVGSEHRILTYDATRDVATWEGRDIARSDTVPME